MLRMTVVSVLLVLATAGCQSWISGKKAGQGGEASTYSLDDQHRQKDQQILKADDLYRVFANHKRIKSRRGQEESIQIYDLNCGMDVQAEAVKCSGYTIPEWIKGSAKIEFNNADSENIFASLLALPIAKGDSGLSTEAVVCRRVVVPGQETTTSCSVMMPIDFVPHSMIPSGH